jgi:hypothetical protein
MFIALVGQSQSAPGFPAHPPLSPPGPPPAAAPTPAATPVNYLIRVEWKETNDLKSLEVLTAAGQFELDTIAKNSVKINSNDIPVTIKLNGTLTPVSDEQGRLQLFLGRTVPYVTGTTGFGSNLSSSWSQMSVGLQSAFFVTFDKPVVIQNDDNGQVSILVKRIEQ